MKPLYLTWSCICLLAACTCGAQGAIATFQRSIQNVNGLFCLEQNTDESIWIGTNLGKILRFTPDGSLLGGQELFLGDTTNVRFVYDLSRAPDGDMYVLYDRSNQNTALDDYLILARIQPNGAFVWQKTVHYGEVQHWAHNRLTTDPDGTVLVVSSQTATANNNEPNRIILTRLAPDGATLWHRALRNEGRNYLRFITRLPDGSYLLGGNTLLTNVSGFLVRLSPDGAVLWASRYPDLLFKAGTTLPDGSWIVAATQTGPLPQQTCVLRLQPDGTTSWALRIVQPNALNWIPDLRVHPQTGNILIFNHETTQNQRVADLIALTQAGQVAWARSYDQCRNYGINAGIVTTDGGIAGLRFRAGGHLFVKTDAMGLLSDCPSDTVAISVQPIGSNSFATAWEVEEQPDLPAASMNLRPFAPQLTDYCGDEPPVTGIQCTPDSICPGQPMLAQSLGAGQADQYRWTLPGGQPVGMASTANVPGITFSGLGPVEVQLAVRMGYCVDTFRQIVVVVAGPQAFDLGPDTSICRTNASIALDASDAQVLDYQWNTGDTTATFTATASGLYAVEARASGCTLRDSIYVELREALPINLPGDTTFCGTDTLLLDATTVGADHYEWNDGVRTPQRVITESGFYAVTAWQGDCIASDFVSVVLFPAPPPLPRDTVLCDVEILRLSVGSSIAGDIRWNALPGTGEYDVLPEVSVVTREVSYRQCYYADTLRIRRVSCVKGFAVYAPNAFAPDDTQGNDVFRLVGPDLEILEFRLFDRWGNLLFQRTDNTAMWDGAGAAPGLYVWTARVRQDGRAGWIGGDVLLVR
jgi:CHU_C Type IX secretion signal domain/Domain of unknown function (DUF5122) beta-propeller